MSLQSTKVGIAIYAQKGSYGRPRNPHWALVLHPTSFSAEDVRVYHIRSRSGVWSLGHEVRDLPGMGDLIGVLHVADVDGEVRTPDLANDPPEPQPVSDAVSDSDSEQKPKKAFSLEELDTFIRKFPANKNGDDPSALFVWSCESYVIRALAHLCEEGAFELPCKPEEMYEYTKRRIVVLKLSPSTKDTISVIPFNDNLESLHGLRSFPLS